MIMSFQSSNFFSTAVFYLIFSLVDFVKFGPFVWENVIVVCVCSIATTHTHTHYEK